MRSESGRTHLPVSCLESNRPWKLERMNAMRSVRRRVPILRRGIGIARKLRGERVEMRARLTIISSVMEA